MLTYKDCLAKQGTTFSIVTDNQQTINLKLIEVSDSSSKFGYSKQLARTPFSLLFHGPKEPLLTQQNINLSNDDLTIEGLIVPVMTAKPDQQAYEICFS